MIVTAVLGVVAYIKLGSLGAALYTETKFEEIRFGPHTSVKDVDQALSWFTRNEVDRAFVNRPLYMSAQAWETLQRNDLRFVSYYIGQSGFVVVFDHDGTKLTQIKTDV